MAIIDNTEKDKSIAKPLVSEIAAKTDAARGPGSPYSRFNARDLILRDELAIDRTLLANERTLLAYLRSAVALVLAGFTMIHFAADSHWFWLAGFISIPVGLLTGLVGTVRFRSMNRTISRIRKQFSEDTGEETGNLSADDTDDRR